MISTLCGALATSEQIEPAPKATRRWAGRRPHRHRTPAVTTDPDPAGRCGVGTPSRWARTDVLPGKSTSSTQSTPRITRCPAMTRTHWYVASLADGQTLANPSGNALATARCDGKQFRPSPFRPARRPTKPKSVPRAARPTPIRHNRHHRSFPSPEPAGPVITDAGKCSGRRSSAREGGPHRPRCVSHEMLRVRHVHSDPQRRAMFSYLPRQSSYHKWLKSAHPLLCRAIFTLAAACPSWFDDLWRTDAHPEALRHVTGDGATLRLAGHSG